MLDISSISKDQVQKCLVDIFTTYSNILKSSTDVLLKAIEHKKLKSFDFTSDAQWIYNIDPIEIRCYIMQNQIRYRVSLIRESNVPGVKHHTTSMYIRFQYSTTPYAIDYWSIIRRNSLSLRKLNQNCNVIPENLCPSFMGSNNELFVRSHFSNSWSTILERNENLTNDGWNGKELYDVFFGEDKNNQKFNLDLQYSAEEQVAIGIMALPGITEEFKTHLDSIGCNVEIGISSNFINNSTGCTDTFVSALNAMTPEIGNKI